MALTGISRISDNLKSSLVLSTMRNVQLDYTKVQQQLATGNKLLTASDDVSAASQVLSLDRVMQINIQISENISNTNSIFSQTDSALLEVAGFIVDAQSSASGSIGQADNIREQKLVDLDAIIEGMLNSANMAIGDVYLFAGTSSSTIPFASEAEGIRYDGAFETREAYLGATTSTSLGMLGLDAFGIEEVSVAGDADLSPAMTADTRLSDLDGALGKGIRLDTIRITDGIVDFNVDLSACDRVGDVVDTINQAGGGAINCSISADGQSFDIASTLPGADLKVLEYNSGYAARDLGLIKTAGGAASFTGGNVNPELTRTTELSQLAAGAGLDLTSGITISNGESSETFTFDASETLGDLLNKLNSSDLGVRAAINSSGDGLDITNLVSGADMHISENGGTTAADLGIRSLDLDTKLADFRDGRGVRTTEGKDDLLIRLTDGRKLNVNLDGATTMGDVIDIINQAAIDNTLPLTASQKTIGNGIELSDSAGGSDSIYVQSQYSSSAAEDLGINGAGTGDTLTGEDTFDMRTGGVFDDLLRLRDAIAQGDDNEITYITERLDQDHADTLAANSRMGGLVQDLARREDRNDAMSIEDEKQKSLLFDTDYYEAVARYAQLETSLQANMATSSSMLSMSLLNYLS